MFNFKRMTDGHDLIVYKYQDTDENCSKYLIRKNRHGDYNVIVNFDTYKKYLNMSELPIAVDVDNMIDGELKKEIKIEIERITNKKLLSKFTSQQLFDELRRRGDIIY